MIKEKKEGKRERKKKEQKLKKIFVKLKNVHEFG